jgi:hypothetical protein
MADLNSLFQNLGPTGGALMSGLTTGQELVSSMQQDQMRQAQMEEILQRTAAAKEMAPLELQSKQQAIDSAALKAKQEKQSYYNDVVGRLIPELEQIPGPARHAYMAERLKNAGLEMDAADSAWAQQHSGDELIKKLKKAHEWQLTQTPGYRQAMDVAREHSRSAENVANINAESRRAAAASKQKATDIVSQVQAGKLTPDKAAVAFSVMSEMETDPNQKLIYQQQAAAFEKLAMNLRAAQNQGKPDIGAATGLPTQQITPALGPGATPPTTSPAKPGLPPGWVLKQ